MVLAAIALTFTGSPVSSEDAASSKPQGLSSYSVFEDSMGAPALELLDSLRHAVVAEFKKGERHLMQVQWRALEPVAAHSAELLSLEALYKALREGDALPPVDLSAVRKVQSLPAEGLITPAIKAAADLAALHLKTAADIGPASTAPRDALLFDEPWGKPMLESSHADVLTDPKPLVPEYFSRVLDAPGADLSRGARHFLSHIQAVYDKDLLASLQADRAAGSPSPELSGWVAKYLLDQKRLWTTARTRSRIKSLEDSTSLRQDMKNLRTVASAFKSAGALADLRLAFETPGPRLKTAFSGPELHVRWASGGAAPSAGEKVVVSAAYWVDGLPPDEKVSVTELGFVDSGGPQVDHRVQQSVSRANGGPYTFTAEWTLPSDKPAAYRLIIAAPGMEPLDRRTRVEPSRLPPAAEFPLAEADSLAQECRFEEASKALDVLAASLPEDDRERRTAIDSHRKTFEAQAALLKELEASLPGARLHASQEQCQYLPDKAERALSLLKRLPPGCDRSPLAQGRPLSEELRQLLETSERRRLNQQAFRAGAAAARRSEDFCRFEEAAGRYASALALLDSDPAARCGEWDQEHSRIRVEDLPRAARASLLAASMDRALEAASRRFSSGDHLGALETAVPLAAAISSMPGGSCYSSQKERAAKLAEAAGVALGPSEAQSLQAALIQDPATKEAADVRAEHEALKSRRNTGDDVRQDPLAPGGPAKAGGSR